MTRADATRTPRTLTEREQRALLKVTGEHRAGYREHMLYAMALGTGLREHELIALSVGDVFREGRPRSRLLLSDGQAMSQGSCLEQKLHSPVARSCLSRSLRSTRLCAQTQLDILPHRALSKGAAHSKSLFLEQLAWLRACSQPQTRDEAMDPITLGTAPLHRSNSSGMSRGCAPFGAFLGAIVAIVSTLLIACGAATPPANTTESGPPADDAPLTQVEREQTITTAAGASVVIPSGWWLAQRGEVIALEDPERELHMWLVEAQGQDLDAAIQDAWLRVLPDFARELDQQQSPPATGGWAELRAITYKTTPDESRAIQAIARRSGDTCYVVLIDTPIAAAQRRGAQLSQVISSQTPPDLEEESFVDAKALPWSPELEESLDQFIQRGVELVELPGLAIAVLYGGELVFERGYGVRGPDGAAVTPDTRFLIGSTSKAFTSLMLARLVDRGTLRWDTPLEELMPTFRLGDPELAKKLQVHHSMCACTGLPRQDFEFLFEFEGVSTEQRLDELASMKPTTGLGETFQYSNALVSAGGFAAAHALLPELPFTNAYDEALRQTVIEPLGLSATHRFDLLPEAVEHALPYGMRIDGSYHPVPLSIEAAIGSIVPAGGLWSNVRDLAIVMQMELDEGQHQGSVFVSRENLLRRREPSVKISEHSHYGLALMVRDKAGLQRVGHGGNTLGFTSHFNFFPQHDLGIIILVNGQAANGLSNAIERELLELLFPNAERRAEKELAFLDTARKESNATLLPKLSAPPAEWLEPLLGEYRNDALGTLALRRQGDAVIADAGEWQIEVAMFEDAGARTLMFVSPPLAGLVLQPQGDGSLLFDAGQQSYVFRK